MQGPLVEIRAANGTARGAYEMRSGVRVGWNDVEARLLTMGYRQILQAAQRNAINARLRVVVRPP